MIRDQEAKLYDEQLMELGMSIWTKRKIRGDIADFQYLPKKVGTAIGKACQMSLFNK